MEYKRNGLNFGFWNSFEKFNYWCHRTIGSMLIQNALMILVNVASRSLHFKLKQGICKGVKQNTNHSACCRTLYTFCLYCPFSTTCLLIDICIHCFCIQLITVIQIHVWTEPDVFLLVISILSTVSVQLDSQEEPAMWRYLPVSCHTNRICFEFFSFYKCL